MNGSLLWLKKRIGAKRGLLVILAIVLAINLAAGVATVFAVHEDFELEGNTAPGDPVTGPDLDASGVDWESLFDVSGGVATPKATLPANFGPVSFIRDFQGGTVAGFESEDSTVFATGSKDTLNIGGGGWQCKTANNVLNQDDLMNVYATAFAAPNGDTILYFGAERHGNNGTKNIGLWFLKDQTVGCPAGPGTKNFTGNHSNGDLFIVSEFSNGGRVSGINVYVWVGGAGGSLNPNPIASGVDCKDEAAGDDACATVNSTDTTGTLGGVFTTPWASPHDAPGNGESPDVQPFEFFEGGVNLTKNNLSACFTKFLVNTRSSDSLGSTIFDFATGSFPLCGIEADKLCSDPAVVGPNPVIDNTDFESFITKFDVTISSTGPGGLFDVKLEEDSTFATGESCRIINIAGAVNPPAVPINNFHNGTAVQVSDTIGATDITVRIECDTFANGFINSVTARASTVNNAASDLSDSDIMTSGQACSAAVNPALSVNKICHNEIANHDLALPPVQASHPLNPKSVDLVYQNGTFLGFGVDVFVQIENTGDVKLKSITLSDDPAITFTPVSISQGTNTHTTTTFNGTLNPGAKAYFKGSYVASAPDNNQTDPCVAQFTDKVTVNATDATSNIPIDIDPVTPGVQSPFDTATCPLCVCPSP